jgi:hypothetical protein
LITGIGFLNPDFRYIDWEKGIIVRHSGTILFKYFIDYENYHQQIRIIEISNSIADKDPQIWIIWVDILKNKKTPEKPKALLG